VVRPGRGYRRALLLARRAGIDLDVLRQALAASAASTAFVGDDLGALLDGDYLTSFGLDRCCEELTAIADLARELRVRRCTRLTLRSPPYPGGPPARQNAARQGS
jgi:3-hydroxyisobutyrate dehydrogenase-like beta-hydroxyacid dehydrogenase